MIDKISGKVAYAVMSFGGFMGIGEDYYPLPWSLLTYNPSSEGYEVNVSEQQLKGAPKYSKHENWDWTDRSRAQNVSATTGSAPIGGPRARFDEFNAQRATSDAGTPSPRWGEGADRVCIAAAIQSHRNTFPA